MFGLRPISQLLNEQRCKTPAQFQAELYGKHNPDIHTNKDGQRIYFWNYTGVKRILIDESYAGTLRNHKAEMHIGKVTRFIPKEEQYRHEDYLPAIVSKKEWLTAQTELASRNGKRVPRENSIAAHRYSGLLKCGDCGAPFVPIIRKTDKKQPNADRYTALITRLTTDHEKARLELNNLETHDANLRRKLREMAKQVSSLDEVLKNNPIDETDLRRLTDYIEVKQFRKTVEVRVMLKAE